MADDPEGEPGSFTLSVKHKVYFVPNKKDEAAEEGDIAQLGLGAHLPRSVWESSKVGSIVWCVKWAVNGLTPIRPIFCLTDPVVVGAARAMRLA